MGDFVTGLGYPDWVIALMVLLILLISLDLLKELSGWIRSKKR